MPHPDLLQKPSETANASIAAVLDKILRERHQSAGRLTKTAEALEQSAKKLEQFQQASAQLEGLSQRDQESLFGSQEALKEFENCMKKAADCQEKLRQAAGTYRGLAVRFQRDTVNLGVVGLMGAGKSRFLRSLSGLSNEYIPSAPGPSCTGVTCVIENVPEQSSTAVTFTFKDEETVQKEINQEIQYLWQKITGQTDGPQLTAPEAWQAELSHAFQAMKNELDVRRVTMGDVFNSWKTASNVYCGQWNAWRPLVYPTKPKQEDGTHTLSDEAWQEQLEQWQRRMDMWEAGLQQYPLNLLEKSKWARDGAPRCLLTDPSQIRNYITKHSVAEKEGVTENGCTEIYDHLCYYITIREAHIRTAFTGVDARICLIDTVGIGDKSTDTGDRMKRAIDVDSDGLIFIHRYPGKREYDSFEEMERLAVICAERASKRPGDWMAYLMNVVPQKECSDEWIINTFDSKTAVAPLPLSESTVNPPEVKASAAALKYYTQALFEDACGKNVFNKNNTNPDGRYIHLRYTANAGEADTVKNFLNQFLKQISEHLEQIDTARIKEAKDLCINAECAKQEFDQYMQMFNIPEQDPMNIVSKRMDEKQAELRQALSSYYQSGLHPDLVSPLKLYRDKLEAIVDKKPDSPLDLKKLVESVWAEHMPDWRRTQLLSMEKLYRKIRRIAATSSPRHVQAETDFKTTVAQHFVEKLGIDLTKLSNLPLHETDKTFFQDIKTSLFQKTDAGDLPQFFDALHHFHLNDSTVMAEAILTHIAAKHLCTYTVQGGLEGTSKPANANVPQDTNPDTRQVYAPPAGRSEPAVNSAKSTAPAPAEKSKVQEIEDDLRQRLRQIHMELETYQETEKSYCISPKDRFQEELIHFIMCFGEPYQKKWMLIFNRLYKDGVILQKETDDFQKIYSVGNHIQQYIDEYRNDNPAYESMM